MLSHLARRNGCINELLAGTEESTEKATSLSRLLLLHSRLHSRLHLAAEL